MAVYKRGYQRYSGPLTGRWTRFLVLPRYAWRRLYQQRLVLLLTILAFVWPLLCTGFIYLTNHVELLQGLDKDFLEFIQVDGRFFSIFMYVQAGFAVFLAALAGPSLIAPDLANNALPLYLSSGPPDGAGRHAVDRDVGSGPDPVRVAGRTGRRLVVPRQLDAWRRYG